MPTPPRDPTAGVVIIGNEILSGKLVDQNSPFLVKSLFDLGVAVKRVVTIPDEIESIADDVRDASDRFDFVLTSGGVGPTHDDVTLEGIARGFKVPLVPHPGLVALLEAHFGPELNEAALRMAQVPEGTWLLRRGAMRYPLLVFRNIYIFPGVPEFLIRKFRAISGEFRGRPYHVVEIRTRQTEELIAAHLRETAQAFEGVEIGSYPRFPAGDHWVLLTLQSKEPEVLKEARAFLCARLDPERLMDDSR